MQVIVQTLQALKNAKFDVEKPTAQRLFHGRGRQFPGLEHLTIDRYGSVVWVVLYRQPEIAWLNALKQILVEHLEGTDWNCSIQHRYAKPVKVEELLGEPVEKCFVEEAGLKYWVHFKDRQNVGFFLDMSNAREWVQARAQNLRVLNLFAFTCAFSVVALKGGAQSVVNLDMSRRALTLGRENHLLNQLPTDRVKFLDHDLFKSWGKLKRLGPYDLIVVDPPSFQPGSFEAARDYPRLVRRLPELLDDNGRVLACLNAPELDSRFLIEAFAQYAGFKYCERIDRPASFPELETEKGLKTLVFRKH